ncbi:hypothetical protein [Streptomyces sp. NPDC001274]
MRRRPSAAERVSAVLLTTALASLALVPTATARPDGPPRAAGTVDLGRYTGTWFQLAARAAVVRAPSAPRTSRPSTARPAVAGSR